MTKPNVTFKVEPSQGESVTYQLLAAPTSNGEIQAQIALWVEIENHETAGIVLSSVDLTVFFSHDSRSLKMNYPVAIAIGPAPWNVGKWWTRKYSTKKEDTGLPNDVSIDQQIVTQPTANMLNVSLKFRDFDEPVHKLFALRPHESPTPAKAYVFPAKGEDLRAGECWNGAGARHEESVDGCQLFALDLGVMGWDDDSKAWDRLKPVDERVEGKRQNSDYRIWRKNVYAMADGEVVAARWDFPENAAPCALKDLDANIIKLIKAVHDGNGNFITVRTDNAEVHLYAHFEPDSIPHNLRTSGAPVKRGDRLGRVGNSGQSSDPHLHIDIRAAHGDYILRPMPFTDMFTINSLAAPKGVRDSDPWFHNTGHGLSVADWPVLCLISFSPGWEPRGGTLTSGPGVCSWGSGRLDVFARGLDNALWQLCWDNGWQEWQQLGSTQIISDPAAVSWGRNRIDVFVRGHNGMLLHKYWDGSHWSGFESLGGTITSEPTACSWASRRLDVFARGTNNALYHKWFDGSWHDWEQLDATPVASDPAAVSWGPNRIDVFVRSTSNSLLHKWWDGHKWNGYEDLGGTITSAPTVSSWASGRLDVFARGTNNCLFHLWFDGKWHHWEQLGVYPIDSNPAAVSWGPNRIDVFARGIDKGLYHKWFDGNWRP